MSAMGGRFSRWLTCFLEADERYICGCCDDRFGSRAEGVSHVVACHPEYAGAFTDEPVDQERVPASEPQPVRRLGAARPFMPVWS